MIPFVATKLVLVSLLCAMGVLVSDWRISSPSRRFRLAAAGCTTIGLSYICARIASAVYFLPPVWTVDHPNEARGVTLSNSFPSHHALLAAAIVALIAFARPIWAIPFALATVLMDWALVVGRYRYAVDVVASTVIVGASAVAGWIVSRRVQSSPRGTRAMALIRVRRD